MAGASRTKIDLPKVSEFFEDQRAGKRVDDVLSKLMYILATQYAPPVKKVDRQFDTVVAFAADDATPDVSDGNAFKTANANPTTITNFDGGVEGQEVWVLVDDSNTTIDFNTGTNIIGNKGANFVAAQGDFILFVRHSGKWYGFITES